jgi:hypothetical protein
VIAQVKATNILIPVKPFVQYPLLAKGSVGIDVGCRQCEVGDDVFAGFQVPIEVWIV